MTSIGDDGLELIAGILYCIECGSEVNDESGEPPHVCDE